MLIDQSRDLYHVKTAEEYIRVLSVSLSALRYAK